MLPSPQRFIETQPLFIWTLIRQDIFLSLTGLIFHPTGLLTNASHSSLAGLVAEYSTKGRRNREKKYGYIGGI